MKTIRIALVCCFLLGASSVMGQTVLYWHPSSGSNQDIDDMVDDIESAGATVTSTSVEEDFYKELVNGPWDLVLVADMVVDTENPDYGSFIGSGGSIFTITTLFNDDLEINLLSAARAMQQVEINPVATAACFAAWANCLWRYPDGCAWTTLPLTQARIECDNACTDDLIACLLEYS